MTFRTIAVTTDNQIAEIRLQRARLAAHLLDELDSAVSALSDNDSVRVVLVIADADGFAIDTPAATARNKPLPFRCLELIPQPVIAVIEGAAAGAGLELALACDIRIAEEGSSFGIGAAASGDMPSLGGTQRLPRLIGRARAAQMILLGETIDAQTALSWGLVNAVTPRGETMAHAGRIASSIRARGRLAVRYAKEAIARGLDMPLDQALRYETDLTVILQTTGDRAEGVRAFLEKREPKFGGT